MTDKFDYLESKEDAEELIVEFGFAASDNQAFIIRTGEQSGPDYNPTFEPDAEFAISAVRDPSGYKNMDIDGTRIKATDAKFYVSALNKPPMVDDRFRYVGDEYEIIDVKPLEPAGTAVMYELQCRG